MSAILINNQDPFPSINIPDRNSDSKEPYSNLNNPKVNYSQFNNDSENNNPGTNQSSNNPNGYRNNSPSIIQINSVNTNLGSDRVNNKLPNEDLSVNGEEDYAGSVFGDDKS